MNRRNFLKYTGWSFIGLAASGSLLSACQQGTAAGKKVMPSASNLKYFWGDLHNHCNITYGHGDTRLHGIGERLDYILVSPSLVSRCLDARIHNGIETEGISDHYPVSVDLQK